MQGDVSPEQASSDQDKTQWPESVLSFMAILGAIGVAGILYSMAIWLSSDAAQYIQGGPGGSPGAAFLILIGLAVPGYVVLVRQAYRRRWACVVSTIASWLIACYAWATTADAVSTVTAFAVTGVCLAASVLLTVAFFAGCRRLKPGF